MKNETSSRILIGVSAHRNIAGGYKKDIKKLVTQAFEGLKKAFPKSEIITVNGLAAGGDTLCAEVALRCGLKIKAVLPVPEEEYLNPRDFTEEQKREYFKIKSSAGVEETVALSQGFGQTEAERNSAFRAQTEYVASRNFLLALWDGTPPESANGCGTSAAVSLARARGVPVIWIFAPREGKTYKEVEPFIKLIADGNR